MDFPQQSEETLIDKPYSYDITMEDILNNKDNIDDLTGASYQNYTNNHSIQSQFKEFINKDINKQNNIMTSSSIEYLDDTTPSDSGVQLLDSESSELMIESITSQNGFDFDDNNKLNNGSNQLPDLLILSNNIDSNEQLLKQQQQQKLSDLENSNVIDQNLNINDDVMTTSNCSTFDTEIVFRRKTKKKSTTTKAPKKRVSFHEDILKNTRTDNIHIEHGFITYKNQRKNGVVTGRYSWCSDGRNGEESQQLHQPENINDTNGRRVVYRNACSDVLDYGNAEIYENCDSNYLKHDNSGIFEYHDKNNTQFKGNTKKLYKCSCNDSNSSLDSDESGNQDYAQKKSNSCDCIGMNNTNNNFIGDACYFSDPNIDSTIQKSVWNKEKKPKSSCLKKTSANFIPEKDLSKHLKKFNVHEMNNLLDNSKMIFGSLKSIFLMPLPERGVPEGSEDVQSVYECLPESFIEEKSEEEGSAVKARPFLSKSLDGNKNADNNNSGAGQKKFIHNVDEQLRRRDETDLYAPTRQNSGENVDKQKLSNESNQNNNSTDYPTTNSLTDSNLAYRNKYIINCESTVFEHTGVSFSYENDRNNDAEFVTTSAKATPIAESQKISKSFAELKNPLKQTFANIFKSFKDTTVSNEEKQNIKVECKKPPQIPNKQKQLERKVSQDDLNRTQKMSKSSSSSNNSDKQSICSDSLIDNSLSDISNNKNFRMVGASPTKIFKNIDSQQSRHLSSPMHQRNQRSNRMSPDIFNLYGGGRDSKASTLLSEEFDDILTITTSDDKNDSDIVILDYPENLTPERANDFGPIINSNLLLKPPKTSLINRFLKNVTQKKIMESSIKNNPFYAKKLKNENKLSSNLYVKGGKIIKPELIEDLNAEIANEIEASITNSPRLERHLDSEIMTGDVSRFELGIGEISIDIFNGNCLHIINHPTEILLKVFKLYTGYSREGYMTPVLVFLTDRALYVTDLVRNRLCNKFIIKYSELDVILMGPYGNTVLLSNSTRDMQQVLLAGGPYPADGLVANLELCARRSGSVLPAVGQLTLQHLAPLQSFVRENSSVTKKENWLYYAVVNTPAGTLNNEKEPLGPNIKGFLMHRHGNKNQNWQAGYFLLKAGVLYLFDDCNQKLPIWAMALAECQGARRSANTGRPHCFEILLKHDILQLAAPDEYVASEWLQALVQTASGLFEMQEKHKTLGCTLIMTQNHLITLREDFTAPLRCLNNSDNLLKSENDCSEQNGSEIDNSAMSSTLSTPTKNSNVSNNSGNTTPNKTSRSNSINLSSITKNTNFDYLLKKESMEKSSANMSSFYGNNSGIEILTCASIKEMTGIRIPSDQDNWWCILEFSCQEVRETSDDLVLFFASSPEMQRFLRMLEQLWQSKNNDLFPMTILDEDDLISEQCTKLYMDINRSWEPLLSAALGYPL